MSKFTKKLTEYRSGENWRTNFKHINYTNVKASLESIFSARERPKQYDRLGNFKGTIWYKKPISDDEKIFRIMVLLDTQMQDFLKAIMESLPKENHSCLTHKHIQCAGCAISGVRAKLRELFGE